MPEIFTSVPDLAPWVVPVLWVLSFFTSALTASAGLGGGLALLAFMSVFMAPAALIPVHGVVQLCSNLGRAWLFRHNLVLPLVLAFGAGSVIGAVIGGNVVVALPRYVLELILGSFILVFLWAPRFKGQSVSPPKFFALGIAASITTMFVGATGPLTGPFVEKISPERRYVVGSFAACMTFQHLFKVIAFGILGFAFGPYLFLLAGMVVFGFLGTLLGRRILLKMPEHIFRLAFRSVLTLLALRLFWSGVSELI